MRPVLAILKRFLLGLIRNRANLGFMVILPVVFTLVFGVVPNLSSNNVIIDVVNHDGTTVSQAIITQINKLPNYTADVVTKTQARADLRNLKASVVITLPKGLQQAAVEGKSVPIDWQPSPNAGSAGTVSSLMKLQGDIQQWMMSGGVSLQQTIAATGANALTGSTANATANSNTASSANSSANSNTTVTVSTDMSQAQLAKVFVNGMQHSSSIHNYVSTKGSYLSQGKIQKQSLSDGQRIVIGFATMFVIFTVFGSTGNIYQEKRNGTWDRLKASPRAKAQILGGYGIGYFLVGWIQFLIMDVTGLVFFRHGLPISGWTALIVSLYVLAIVGIALCIAGVVTSFEQHMMIGSFIGVATSMLGGAYWPLDLEPSWMQKVAWFVPQSWAIDAFKAVAIGVISLGSVAIPLAVLGAFAVIFFSAGILQLRYS